MTASMKHFFNPLHIYCRLRNVGVGKGIAIAKALQFSFAGIMKK